MIQNRVKLRTASIHVILHTDVFRYRLSIKREERKTKFVLITKSKTSHQDFFLIFGDVFVLAALLLEYLDDKSKLPVRRGEASWRCIWVLFDIDTFSKIQSMFYSVNSNKMFLNHSYLSVLSKTACCFFTFCPVSSNRLGLLLPKTIQLVYLSTGIECVFNHSNQLNWALKIIDKNLYPHIQIYKLHTHTHFL